MFFMQEFIFLFRMFLYVDVLEVVIQSVQLLQKRFSLDYQL